MYKIRIIVSETLFIELSTFIIVTVSELLTIDYLIQQTDAEIIIANSTMELLAQMGMAYFMCFYAEKYTSQTFKITHLVYCDLLWVKLPIHYQKSMILPIIRAQKLFRLRGFLFDASMETYLNVGEFYNFLECFS